IKLFVVRREAESIWLVSLSGHEIDLPGLRINTVDGFLQQKLTLVSFIISHAAVSRVGEPYATVGMHDNIVGRIEGFPLPLLRKNRKLSVVFEAHHAARRMFAGKQPPFPVESISIRVVGGFAKLTNVPIVIKPAALHVVGNVAPN